MKVNVGKMTKISIGNIYNVSIMLDYSLQKWGQLMLNFEPQILFCSNLVGTRHFVEIDGKYSSMDILL